MKQPIIALVTTFTYMNASYKTKVSELGHFALFFLQNGTLRGENDLEQCNVNFVRIILSGLYYNSEII